MGAKSKGLFYMSVASWAPGGLGRDKELASEKLPIASMYGIFTSISHKIQPNVR